MKCNWHGGNASKEWYVAFAIETISLIHANYTSSADVPPPANKLIKACQGVLSIYDELAAELGLPSSSKLVQEKYGIKEVIENDKVSTEKTKLSDQVEELVQENEKLRAEVTFYKNRLHKVRQQTHNHTSLKRTLMGNIKTIDFLDYMERLRITIDHGT